jgi:hypothetical protein
MYDYDLILLREYVATRSRMLKARAAKLEKKIKTYKFL